MSASVELGTTRSGGRLGGISTMVTQADVCPSCGGRHETRRRAFWERAAHPEPRCPDVVHGTFPVLMKLPEPEEVIVEFPFEHEAGRGGNASASPHPDASTGARRLAQMPIPWPAPNFDEAYL